MATYVMNAVLKETTGFLCRWCLLVVCCGLAASAGWSALVAGSAIAGSADAQVVLSDAAWRPWQRINAVGYLMPEGWATAHTQFVVVSLAENPWIVYGSKGKVFATIQDPGDFSPFPADELPTSGRIYHLNIKGVPYGGYAFHQAQAILSVLPHGRRVFAVDARLGRRAAVGGEDVLALAMDRLTGCGSVVFFYVAAPDKRPAESAAHYLRVRADIRGKFPSVPVVYVHGSKRKLPALAHLGATLGRYGRNRPVVVTQATDVAKAAAEGGYLTYLVSSFPGETVSIEKLRWYESWAAFAAWLTEREPMTQD